MSDQWDDRLDTRRVRYFIQVLDSGSVRGAADALGMDPSVISRAIGVLERDCGTQLLERRGRGVVPTDAGELLAGYLREQAARKQRLLAQLESIQAVESGHVDLIAGEGFVDWLMRSSLKSFLKAHPAVTVDLTVAGTDRIVQSIVQEQAHIGLVFQPPRDERLLSHHSHSHPIVTHVLRDHPLAAVGRPLRLADLQPYAGAVLHRSYGVRQHIEAAEISEGVRLNGTLTTSSFSAIGHFVAAGLGYALSTRLQLPQGFDGARIASLPMHNRLLSQGRVQVVTRAGRNLNPAADRLLRRIVDDIARLSG